MLFDPRRRAAQKSFPSHQTAFWERIWGLLGLADKGPRRWLDQRGVCLAKQDGAGETQFESRVRRFGFAYSEWVTSQSARGMPTTRSGEPGR